MRTIDKLKKEFLMQNFSEEQLYAEKLAEYQSVARNYARLENVIAVLSDMRTNTSYIYHGDFSHVLGVENAEQENKVHSIWEEEIFRLIHPDDLTGKYLQELRFFHFVKRQPKKKRSNFYLASKLRMKDKTSCYISVLHRLFYISIPSCNSLWLALCLCGPLAVDLPVKCMIVNSVNGQITELETQNDTKILTEREKQILRFINKGLMSKEIAKILSISINTVSRHRQEILGKLHVKNSIEACQIAKDLKLI